MQGWTIRLTNLIGKKNNEKLVIQLKYAQ
jgi:hypothetical protein